MAVTRQGEKQGRTLLAQSWSPQTIVVIRGAGTSGSCWTPGPGYASFQPERCGFGCDRRIHPRPEDQGRSAWRRAPFRGRRGFGHRRCRSRAPLFQWSGWLLGVSCCYGRSVWYRLSIRRTGSTATDAVSQRAARSGAPKSYAIVAVGPLDASPLVTEDEFTIVVLDPSGVRRSYERSSVQFQSKPDVGTLRSTREIYDDDMHNVYAYLLTLK